MTLDDFRTDLKRRRRAFVLSLLGARTVTQKQVAHLADLQSAISAVSDMIAAEGPSLHQNDRRGEKE